MRKSDNCKLYLGTTMVAQKTITEDIEVDKHVTLFIEPPRLPSGDRELSYQITRFGQKPEPGPTIKLFVKLELPGGQDLNPDYGHSELTMAFDPPDVVRDGVDKATAEKGVLVYAKPKPGDGWLYLNCAAGDVLILGWAGKTVESEPVTQAQIDDPEGNPIVVLADKDIILSAGDSDGVSVSYKIRDCVYNESEDWCEAVRIVVDTQGLRLGAPILKQADGLIVDLEALGEERPLVEVWAEDVNIFKKFDEIYLSIFGTDDEGKEISELVIQRIESNPPVRVSIAHKNSTLRALAKRTVVYAYHVCRGGEVVDNSRSKSRAYSVIGEPTRLAAPIALDATSGALDPYAPEYRIRIPYDPLITADNAIELKWFGTRSDFTTYDPELDWYFPSEDEAKDPEGFIITVPGEHGETLLGGTLRLLYEVLTDKDGTITRRASLHAPLLNVGEARPELVKPIVLGEKDGVLEPKDLPGGTSKITAPRPVAVPSEANDIVKFFWIVEGNEPVTDFKKLNALSKDKDVDFPLNAAFVAQHIEPNRGKKVQVSYEIFRAASNTTSQSNVLEFTVGKVAAIKLPDAKVDEANADQLNPEDVTSGATIIIAASAQLKDGDEINVTLEGKNTYPHPTYTVKPEEADKELSSIKLPHSVIDAEEGGSIALSFTVKRKAGGTDGPSEPTVYEVSRKIIPIDLPVAEINEANGDQLNPDDVTDGATIIIAASAQLRDGDEINVTLEGENTYPHPTYTVKPEEADKELSSIKLPHSVIDAEEGGSIALSFTVKRKAGGTDGPSEPTVYEVSRKIIPIDLPVAEINEANGDQLNPDDVTDGATIIIAASAQLKDGDEINVTLEGKNTYPHPTYTVKPEEADKELSSIKLPHSVIDAEEGGSIALSFTVKRKAGGTDGPSAPAVYDVRKVIAPGKLRVMGARYNRSVYRAASTSRLLMAFDAATGKPLQAEWKYAAESKWTKASTWFDTAPQEHLQVRTADDQVTLSEANIFGTGSNTTITGQAAFVALRDKNDMTGWGNGPNGGVIPPTIITMNDIIEVSATRSTFAARRTNDTTIAWSTTAGEGNDMGTVNPVGFVRIVGNIAAFAGIRANGTVEAWSTAANGGVPTAEIKAVTNAVDVIPAGQAFAVRLATGHVKAWGLPADVGTVPAPIASLDDIEDVIGNSYAFAAYRANGTLVAWGNATYGGNVPAPIAAMTDIKRLACANKFSFVALRKTNQVIAWGPVAQGGTVPQLISTLTDILSVVATWNSFAALRENGHVVAWPETSADGKVPDAIAARNDVVQVAGTSHAFAVLFKDGTVAAWGNATVGGDTKPVADQLTDVRAIYTNTHGFTALTADGRVVTWGQSTGGGNSSTVQDRLKGMVSYLATPASRGIALKASRLNKTGASV
jgi:alpha-tubulin suppressor-like RCC1 family protein